MKTKYNNSMKELIIKTLSNNDITNKELCSIIGISECTLIEWTKPTSKYFNSELSELITDLRENYRNELVYKLENELENLAFGNAIEITTEVKKDKDGNVKWIKTKTIKRIPNLQALIILAKKYKLPYIKQDVDTTSESDYNKFLEDWNKQSRDIAELLNNPKEPHSMPQINEYENTN